jgi:hypothetical protein
MLARFGLAEARLKNEDPHLPWILRVVRVLNGCEILHPAQPDTRTC